MYAHYHFSLRFAELLSAPQLESASLALGLLTKIPEVRVLALPCWMIWNI
jgi:hypothetical protein